MADLLPRDQARLYDLIWRRFVASQMAPARFLNTRATIVAGDFIFRATGSVLVFDGFQRVWKRDEERDRDEQLPSLEAGDLLRCLEVVAEQHFTQPPPRYTEASLVKEMEERGIGRPSTYAPTIEVIQERAYVRQEERRLHPTELGKTVDGLLREHFAEVVDIDFTADLERRLDAIETGKRKYETTVRDWYTPFSKTVDKAQTDMQRVKVPAKSTGEVCPRCGTGELVIREGRFGPFVGCSRYPECDYIKDKKQSSAEPTGESCPAAGSRWCSVSASAAPSSAAAATRSAGSSATWPPPRTARPPTPRRPPPRRAPRTSVQCPECGKPLAHETQPPGDLRRLHRLPRLPLHPAPGRPRRGRAGAGRRAHRRELSGLRQAAGPPPGALRAFRELQRLPGMHLPPAPQAGRRTRRGRLVSERPHATTIVGVRRNGVVAIGGDGQVTVGDVVMKHRAAKVRRLHRDTVLAGFAGAVADALTLFDKFEQQLDRHQGLLLRAAVGLAKEWRTDRYLRHLEAMLIVANADQLLLLSGDGEIIEPDDDLAAIGSGGPYALAAAKALLQNTELDAAEVVRRSLAIAASLCIYTN